MPISARKPDEVIKLVVATRYSDVLREFLAHLEMTMPFLGLALGPATRLVAIHFSVQGRGEPIPPAQAIRFSATMPDLIIRPELSMLFSGGVPAAQTRMAAAMLSSEVKRARRTPPD